MPVLADAARRQRLCWPPPMQAIPRATNRQRRRLRRIPVRSRGSRGRGGGLPRAGFEVARRVRERAGRFSRGGRPNDHRSKTGRAHGRRLKAPARGNPLPRPRTCAMRGRFAQESRCAHASQPERGWRCLSRAPVSPSTRARGFRLAVVGSTALENRPAHAWTRLATRKPAAGNATRAPTQPQCGAGRAQKRKRKRRSEERRFRCRVQRDDYFFGAIAGAGAGAAAGAAAAGSAPILVVLPALMMATGSTLPPFIWKIVISASLRSPLSSNSM